MAELEDGTLSFEARLELVSKDVQNVKQQLEMIGKTGEGVGNKIDKSLNDAFANMTKSLGSSTDAVVGQLNELVIVSRNSSLNVQAQLQSIQDKLSEAMDARVPKDSFDKMEEGAEKASETMENVLLPTIEKVTKAMKKMVAGFTVQQIITQIGKTRGEFQQLEVAFETMLGSEERSSKLMNELVNTAAHTPFDLKGIADGAKQLLAYGFAAEDVNKTLVMLGDVASGLSIPLNDIVYLYGTTMTQGRLMTKDLYQFMGRGIPLLKELKDQLDTDEAGVFKFAEQGKIGFENVAKAMQAMTSEGGQFYNLMDKQSKTINGLVSNLGDAIDTMMNDVGQKTEGIFTDTLKVAINVVENYERVGKAIAEAVAALGLYKGVLVIVNTLQAFNNKVTAEAVVIAKANAASTNAMSKAEVVAAARKKILKAQTEKLTAALKANALANPYALLAAGAVAFGFAIYKAITYQTELQKIHENMEKAAVKAVSSAEAEIAKLNELKGTLSGCKEGTEEYNNVKKEIIDNFSKYDSTLTDETTTVQTLAEKYNDLTSAIQKSFAIRAFNESYDEALTELTEQYTEDLKTLKKELISAFGTETGAEIHQEFVNAIREGDVSAEITTWGALLTVKVKGIADNINKLLAPKFASSGGRKLFGFDAGDLQILINRLSETSKAMKNLRQENLQLYALTEEDLTAEQKAAEEKRKQEEEERKKKEEEEQQKKEAADRKKKQKKYQEEIKEAIIKGEYDIAQAQIDAMGDGWVKEEAQLDLNYQKRLHEIERQKKKYEEENKELYGSAELTDDQKKILQQMRTLADSYLETGTRQLEKNKKNNNFVSEELKERLKTWEDFSEKQTQITEEYAEKRKKIEDDKTIDKTTQDNRLAELARQEQMDAQILLAQMGITDQNVADELTKIIVDAYKTATTGAVDELQNQLFTVEVQLQDMLKTGINESNEEQYRKLTTQQKALQKAVKKAKDAQVELQNKASKTGLTIKDKMDIATNAMSTLNAAIGDVRNSFGDLFSDATNEALDAIQVTMDAGIGVLNALKTAGVGTATAISTAEKASVILTVISVAVQAVTALVKSFSSLSASRVAEQNANDYFALAEKMENTWKKYRHDHRNSLGDMYYDEMFDDIDLLRQEYMEMEHGLNELNIAKDEALSKKRKDKLQEEIYAKEDELRDLEKKIEEQENEFFQNILQTNGIDFASSMADQLVEGWENGLRDMSAIFDDAMNDMMKSVVKNQLRMELEKVYGAAFEDLKNQFSDGASQLSQSDLDEIKARVQSANEEAQAVADFYRQWWDALELNTGDLSASVGAIQGMTQDTAEELNGRFTALQMSGASIDLKMDSVVAGIHSLIGTNSGMADSIALAVGIANDQLNVLEDIRNHTARLASMERSLNTITNQMSTLTGQ